MRRSSGLIWPAAAVLGLAAALACAPGGDGERPPARTDLVELSAAERGDLQAWLPAATHQETHAIEGALLDAEDLELENTIFLGLFDATGELLGYARDVFTPVACLSGACQAIHFVLLFDPQVRFLAVFHPRYAAHDLMKYWDGEHVPFSLDDRARLNAILAAPPEDLVEAPGYEALVTDARETAPTLVLYQDDVVRGAAFTTYVVLLYMLDSQALITESLRQED